LTTYVGVNLKDLRNNFIVNVLQTKLKYCNFCFNIGWESSFVLYWQIIHKISEVVDESSRYVQIKTNTTETYN